MRFKILGITAYIIYAIHAYCVWKTLPPENLLWMCHTALLLIGTGYLLKRPTLNAIGGLWLFVGVPLWIMEIFTTGEVMPTSILLHLGGLTLALYGVYRLGFPKHIWWKALLTLAALWQITRWLAPETSNINLALRVWNGWEEQFPSYFWYMVMNCAMYALVFWGVERLYALFFNRQNHRV